MTGSSRREGESVSRLEEAGATGASPGADELFRALASGPRRRVLGYLVTHSTASLGELADVVAGWRAARHGGMVDERARERIRLSLFHNHLPMLEDTGLVEFDAESREASIEPLADEAVRAIRFANEYDEQTG